MRLLTIVFTITSLILFSCQNNSSKTTEPSTKNVAMTSELSKEETVKEISKLSELVSKALDVEADNSMKAKKILMMLKESKLKPEMKKKVVIKEMEKKGTSIEHQKEIVYILDTKL